MAAVGGLLVGAGSGLVSVSSPLNPPITNNFLKRSKRVRTKDPISNKIVKLAILHKETSKMVAHRMADLKAVVHKVVAKAKVARKVAVRFKCHKKAMVAHKGMVQIMA